MTFATGGSGTFTEDEIVYQGTDLANATFQAVTHTWHPTTRKLDVIRVQGTYANNANTKGATSGAYWTSYGTTDDTVFDNGAFEDIVDNTRIENEADGIIDFTETNPFGEA